MHFAHPDLSLLVVRQHQEDLRRLAGHARPHRDGRAALRERSRRRGQGSTSSPRD